MTKKTVITFVLAFVLLIGAAVTVVMTSRSFSVYIPEQNGLYFTDFEVRYSDEGVVELSDAVHIKDRFKLTFMPIKQGDTEVYITCYSDGSDEMHITRYSVESTLGVGPFDVVYERGSISVPNVAGYPVIYITVALLALLFAVYLFLILRDQLREYIYSYRAVLRCSLMILAAGFFLLFTALSAYLLYNYSGLRGDTMRGLTTEVFVYINLATSPLVLIFSVSMTVSNISLIRHEGFRFANMLGIIISVFMTLGTLFFIAMPRWDIYNRHIYSVLSAMYVLFEAYLLGTGICAVIAAKHTPAFDRDYIIILGCGIKEDGTLYPLLKGRVDKAIAFYHKQLETTGKKAVFVPSGGQGSDEIISEGEAMRRYLLEQGIPEEQIMPETESATTLENMGFSKRKIADEKAKIAFSTTNYHVFRSGILAAQAGLHAEGMGSKTKWYFWPNAFIREFAGLLVNRRVKIIILFVIAAALSFAFAFLTE